MGVDPYIKDLLQVIREFRYDNTYKLVWAKSIVSLCTEGQSHITLYEIAQKVIPLYWNLHIHFDPEGNTLRQGNNHSKPPEILQIVVKAIQKYKQFMGDRYKPVFYERLSNNDIDKLDINYNQIAKILNQDVAHRFLNIAGSQLKLYHFNKGDEAIVIDKHNVELINKYADILSEAIQLRWTKILEDINTTTPRIAAKLSLSLDKNSRRSSLLPFRSWLDIQNPNRICSQCNEPVSDDELSIDHVIPWSFLYSDNLWNLVYMHKSCNSSKSNITPDKAKIKLLDDKNQQLCMLIEKHHKELMNKKPYKELKAAINDGLLNKMWTLYRGY